MTELNELDLAAIGKIQELKNATIGKAKEIYRKLAKKLANEDVENRAELILDAVQRGIEVNGGSEEVDEPVAKKKAAKKEPKAKKEKAPKAAKKSNGVKKPSKSAIPRIEHPLAKLEREVELTPVPETHLYTANLFGKKHVMVWTERNRSTGAETRFQSVNVSESQLDELKKYAKAEDLPAAVCCTVRVLGKLDQGYAIPLDVFSKEKAGKSGFNLSGASRKAYSEDGWDGIKFSKNTVAEKAA